MDIQNNIIEFKNLLKDRNCTLVAVSKTKSGEEILEAYDAGQRDFGENKVQELREKEPVLPKDIRWHMIGHLQSNKVKYIAPYVYLIHAVDSFKLLKEINKQAIKNGRVINCLLQIHIAEEESKFGLSEKELKALLVSDEFKSLQAVKIIGLMGMATYTDDEAQIRKEFRQLKGLLESVKNKYKRPNIDLRELSIGMSGDYHIALEEGTTMIRVGSKIFGPRVYH
jgi:pyridoxal phosphate enzyme (YggS family)